MTARTYSNAKMFHFGGPWETPPSGVRRTAHILLTRETDGGISAVALNLPGCASQGSTIAEALVNVREAIVAALEVYKSSGMPVPWRDSRRDEIPPFSEVRYILIEEK